MYLVEMINGKSLFSIAWGAFEKNRELLFMLLVIYLDGLGCWVGTCQAICA